jgi:hypothetical protein
VAEQFVAVQPVGERLEQDQRADQRDELDACRAAQRAGAPGQPDATEQVVPQQVRHQGEERRDEQEVQDQPVERKVERVEPEVHAELRVGDPEFATVHEQLHLNPVGLTHQSGEQADEDRQADAEQP